MDLFGVVQLPKPCQVTVGVRPLRGGEEPILEATSGRTLEMESGETGGSSSVTLEAIPLQSVPSPRVPSPLVEPSHIDVAENLEEEEEVSQRLKRKRALSGDGASSSRKKRPVILDMESSSDDASPPSPSPDTASRQ